MKLFLDLETRSPVPIKHGVAKYSTKVEIIMAQWAIDDGEVVVEDLTGSPPPSEALLDAAVRADEIWAHGAEFETHALATVPWWPILPLAKWRCTMALARMHGLPGALAKLSEIFNLSPDEAKDTRGYELIQLFCIPRKDGRYNDRHSHPQQWAEFLVYGGLDISAMRAVHRLCPKWNATPRMWSLWHLDQRMNARGVAMDLKLAQGAVDATTKAKARMADRTEELTLGMVERTTQRDRLLAYMADSGVDLPDLTADTVERRLEDESLPQHIKELLRVRQQASKASTAKYQRVLTQHVAGRLRNLLVFCGASRTGRWAGRTLQPQNLPRPKHEQWDIDHAITRFHDGTIAEYAPDEVLGLASSALRGLIVSAPGRKLVVSDLANIEGRFMAWVAGEQWKIAAFVAYDLGRGADLYKIAYARAFNIDPVSIGDNDWRRQIGKVMELALQYYGGVGAFCSMAETYGLRLEDLAKSAWPVIPATYKREAKIGWGRAVKRHRTYGLDERTWMVCQALVLMWRAAHPAICKFWEDLDRACTLATHTANKEYKVGSHISVDRVGNWLRIKLPSGRYLSYPAPRGDDFTSSFMGVDPYTKQWKRISTYSGKRAENIAQGGSADILMDGLLAADEDGYNPVLSVHDEAITEPPDTEGYTDKALSKLLIESSLWADGMPLAAKGFTAKRYRK
jgi:DNA polymerase bacteriophage-type